MQPQTGSGELAAAQQIPLGQPSAWRLHFPSGSSSVQLLVVSAAWNPQQAADALPTPGSCWQHLPHELHADGTNRDETHPGMREQFISPACLCSHPFQMGFCSRTNLFHTLIAQWGNVGATGEENGGLTARREGAQSDAACSCLAVGVWQRLGPGYFCCCSPVLSCTFSYTLSTGRGRADVL